MNSDTNLNKMHNKNKILLIIGSIVIIVGVIICCFLLFKNDDIDNSRVSRLTKDIKSEYGTFMLKDKKYVIGEYTKKFLDDGYTIDDSLINNDVVQSDNIVIKTFYYEGKPMFLATLYCAKKESCKYEETKIIKINFYEDSKVLINELVKFGLYIDKVEKKYGKSIGKFYQNENLLVWDFGNKKIGGVYYIIGAQKVFLTDVINDIRIGVWWFDEEADHVIK